jgi:hypothetical protein
LTVRLNSIANSLPTGLYDDTIIITNRVSGKSQARKVALRVGQPNYFTGSFADEDNDIDFQTITFTPDGSKDFYSVCRETATAFPTDPSSGAILSLADDDFAKVVLGDGVHVSLYGTNHTAFYVSANGSVTFIQGVSEFQESLEAHFSLPRISMLFDDLDPAFDGLVSWTQLPDLVAVTFENVPNFFEANQNSFQLEMFFDGRIRLTLFGDWVDRRTDWIVQWQGITRGLCRKQLQELWRLFANAERGFASVCHGGTKGSYGNHCPAAAVDQRSGREPPIERQRGTDSAGQPDDSQWRNSWPISAEYRG